MEHLYGNFSENQIAKVKKSLQGSIFFLLLYVDPNTTHEYQGVDVNKSFKSLLLRLGGLNQLLKEQPELVTVMSLLQAAMNEYNSKDFDFKVYRKLVLDAGAEVKKLKEV